MANTAMTQDLEVEFSAAASVAPGGTVSIDVSVNNFDRLISAQFSINWNALAMSFNDVTNITSDLVDFGVSNIGTPVTSQGVQDGQLRISWSANAEIDLLNGVTIPDGTVLFTFLLNGDGAPCSEVDLILSDDPLAREVADVDLNVFTAITAGANIFVQGPNCMDGGPVAGCAISGNTNGVGLIAQELMGEVGDEVCIEVSVANWTNIQSAQSGITWDPSILMFNNSQAFNLPGLNASSFTSNNPGELRFIWFDNTGSTPSTLADGDVIFELCFTLIGDVGDSSDILFVSLPSFNIEIADDNQNSLDVFTDCGEIAIVGMIDPPGGPDGCDPAGDMNGVGLLTVEMSVAMGDNICIPISVENFIDIQSAQSGMTWDETMFSFTGTQNYNPDFTGLNVNSFNSSNASSGELRFIWFDNTGVNPVDLADGTEIFEVCFDVIGECDEFSDILFQGFNNFSIEFSNSTGSTLPFFTDCGELNITCVTPPEDITFIVEDATANTGDELCVNFSTTNFIDIASLQMNIVWDESVLEYNSPNIQCRNTEMGINAANFNFIEGNKLRVSWSSSTGGVTLAGSQNGGEEVMFCVCFDVIGCSTEGSIVSDIEIVSDANVMIEVGNSDSMSVPVIIENGSVTIAASAFCGPEITENGITPPDCFGGLGSIDVTVTGMGVMCNWDNTGASTNCNLIALAGVHILVATDANGQSTMETFTIPEPSEITATFESSNETCTDGGTILLSPSGGTGDLSVVWTGSPSCSPNDCVGTTLSGLGAGTYTYTITDDNDCTSTGEVVIAASGDGPVISEKVSPVSCDGLGSIELTSSINPVDVEWMPAGIGSTLILNNLPTGTYTYIVTDPSTGCTVSNSIEIVSIVEEFVVTTSTTNVTCNGLEDGVIDFDIMGGCPIYSLTINYSGAIIAAESISNLPAGTYEVSVIDGSDPANINTSIVTITQPDPLSFTLGVVTESTNGMDGSIMTTTVGGTSPYTYVWTGCASGVVCDTEDITGLAAGIYNATVTDDNGCTAVLSATGITVPGPGEVSIANIDVISSLDNGGFGVSCPGLTGDFCDGSIDATLVGFAGALTIDVLNSDGSLFGTYDALPVDGICAGVYTLSITDASSNSAQQMFIITEPDEIVIEDVTVVGTPPGAIDIEVTGGVAPYTYLWNAPLNVTTQDVEDLEVGTYSVFVTDANNCTQLSENYVIMDPDGEACYTAVPIITPNGDGVNDVFYITCAGNNATSIDLYDRWGRVVYSDVAFNTSNSWEGLDNSGKQLTEGAYYWVLQVTFNNGSSRLYKGTVTLLRE